MDPRIALWLAATLVGILALGCLGLAMRALRRARLVEDLPTSKAAGVFIGLVECHGTAESEAPFTSALAGLPCVHHAWSVEEHWQRTVTTTTTDGQGRTRTETRVESGTTTVASGGESAPFWLRDETGLVRVDPAGADRRCERTFRETCGRGDPLYLAHAPDRAVAHSTHRRTLTEHAIPLHHAVYVIGRARLREDAVAPEIAADEAAPLFVISTAGEESVRRGYGWAVWGWGALATLIAAGATVLGLLAAHAGRGPRPSLGELSTPPAVLAFAFGAALAWAGAWAATVYNALIGLRERARRGDSLIDVELQRRADLIPRLVGSVATTADHEAETQRALALLRAQGAVGARALDPDAQGIAPALRAVVERHPELTSDDAFRALQAELVRTEDRIARARAYANALGANYNTRLERIPDRWIAALARLPRRPLFAAAGFERRPVEVELAD